MTDKSSPSNHTGGARQASQKNIRPSSSKMQESEQSRYGGQQKERKPFAFYNYILN